MNRLAHRLAEALALIAGLLLVLMMVHVTLDVVLKYFLKMPVPGTAEVVAAYYMIGTVFLSLAYIEVHNRPIVVELFYDRLPRTLQAPLDVVGTLASMTFYALLGWQSTKTALAAYENQEWIDGVWRVVVWPSRFLIPLGLAVATIVLALRVMTVLRGEGPEHGSTKAI